MTNQQLATALRNNMFAGRDTLDEAFHYALDVANASDNPAAVITAVMVVCNTIADEIEKADEVTC